MALLAVATFPPALDVLIPALFLGYGAAIVVRLKHGADLPGKDWRVIGIVLMASALSDVFIVAANIAGAGHLTPWIICFYTVANLLTIGTLTLTEPINSFAEASPDEPAEVSERDEQIMAQLGEPMREKQLTLTPDLTLAKLSRRLRIPAEKLSAAINRSTGENVSRYVNIARIAAAQVMLQDGASVTQAMLASGFNTKSNFNRAFLRVTGASPSGWRERR